MVITEFTGHLSRLAGLTCKLRTLKIQTPIRKLPRICLQFPATLKPLHKTATLSTASLFVIFTNAEAGWLSDICFHQIGKKNLMMKQISKNNSLLISPWKLTQALLRQQAASCTNVLPTITQHNVFQQFSTAPEMCVCVCERERERGRQREREIGPRSTILMSRIVNNELEGIWKEAIEVLRYSRHLPEKNQEQFQFGLRLKPNCRFILRISSNVHDCFSYLNPELRGPTVYKIVRIRYVRSSCKVYLYTIQSG